MNIRSTLPVLLLGSMFAAHAADAPPPGELAAIAQPLPPLQAPGAATTDEVALDEAALDAPAPPPPPIDLDYRPPAAP